MMVLQSSHLTSRVRRYFGARTANFLADAAQVNTLGEQLMTEFEATFAKLESDPKVRAAVLLSGKPGNFIAGADINMLDQCSTAEELTELAHNGQRIMDRIAASKKPIVAGINGQCLGGGLEVALAWYALLDHGALCVRILTSLRVFRVTSHYRIASSHPKTSMGLPEVMLGLLPGAGGTQRLPKAVGLQQAITMMTTGKNLKADKAKRAGLVHAVADPHALEHAALLAARGLADGTLKPKVRDYKWRCIALCIFSAVHEALSVIASLDCC